MHSWTSIRYLILISGLLSAYAGLIAHEGKSTEPAHEQPAAGAEPARGEHMAHPARQETADKPGALVHHYPLSALSDVEIRRVLDMILHAPGDYVGADLLHAQVGELTEHERLGEYAQQVLEAMNEAAMLHETEPHEARIAGPEETLASDDALFKLDPPQGTPPHASLAGIRDALIYAPDAQASIALISSAAHLQSEASLALVLAQARHGDKAVRRGVVEVLNETLEQGWAAPGPILDTLQALQDDPSPGVAESARRVLDGWTRS